jgi:hypothetical protein
MGSACRLDGANSPSLFDGLAQSVVQTAVGNPFRNANATPGLSVVALPGAQRSVPNPFVSLQSNAFHTPEINLKERADEAATPGARQPSPWATIAVNDAASSQPAAAPSGAQETVLAGNAFSQTGGHNGTTGASSPVPVMSADAAAAIKQKRRDMFLALTRQCTLDTFETKGFITCS